MTEYWDIYDADGNKTGRLHKRGEPMQEGEYHLVVHVWVVNSNGNFLIQKRIPGTKDISNKWEAVGGHAVAGESSLQAAVREAQEEIGIILDPSNGQLFMRYIEKNPTHDGSAFCDVWVFKQDVNINDVVLNPGEACDAMLANAADITKMVSEGIFRSRNCYPYIDELFKKRTAITAAP